MHLVFAAIALLTGLVYAAQLDPIDDFCWRWDHQSALLDGKVYINGGYEIYALKNSAGKQNVSQQILGTNNNVFSVDVSENWDWSTVWNFFSNEYNSTKSVPTVAGGALWADSADHALYLYGGTTSGLNRSFSTFSDVPSDEATTVMWKYNVDGADKGWSAVNLTMEDGSDVPRYAYGANTYVDELRLGFWLGGRKDNGTSPATSSDVAQLVASFLVFDIHSGKVRDLTNSTAGLSNRLQTGSKMIYVPEYGSKGVLVLMGGAKAASGSAISMEDIAILDLATLDDDYPTWVIQKTDGSENGIPEGRSDFCIVEVSAQDNSSHNIYLYGGWNQTNHYDDVWTLSLPSFTWIRLFKGTDEREGHTCHVVGKSQMLTIAGDHASIGNKGACDWEYQSVAILDMSDPNQWPKEYDPQMPAYTLPDTIYSEIGGNETGFATKKTPASGWSDSTVAALFSTNTTAETAAPSSPPNKSDRIEGGAIAGVVIGVIVAIAGVLGAVLWRRRKNRKAAPAPKQPQTEQAYSQQDYRYYASSPPPPPPPPPAAVIPPEELPESDRPPEPGKIKSAAELEAAWPSEMETGQWHNELPGQLEIAKRSSKFSSENSGGADSIGNEQTAIQHWI